MNYDRSNLGPVKDPTMIKDTVVDVQKDPIQAKT